MGFSHNYINSAGSRPTKGSTTTGEIVVNVADGTLWTKDLSGNVVRTGLSHVDKEWVIPNLRSGIQVFNQYESVKWKFLNHNTILVTGVVRGTLNGLKSIFDFPDYVAKRIRTMQFGTVATATVSHGVHMRCYVTGSGSGVFCTQMDGSSLVSFAVVNQLIILDM